MFVLVFSLFLLYIYVCGAGDVLVAFLPVFNITIIQFSIKIMIITIIIIAVIRVCTALNTIIMTQNNFCICVIVNVVDSYVCFCLAICMTFIVISLQNLYLHYLIE